MKLRSSEQITSELAGFRAIAARRLEANNGEGLTPGDGWEYLQAEDDERRIAELERELAEVAGDLEVSISGPGVLPGNRIYLAHLNAFTTPLRGALKWTARDIATEDGMPPTSGQPWELLEPVFAGSREGSFVINVARGPADEQMSLVSPLLFEQACERVVGVFAAASEAATRQSVVRATSGLRRNAIANLKALAKAMVDTGQATHFRWRGGTVVTVAPVVASSLIDVLEAVDVEDETRTVTGRMAGVDVIDKTFHIDGDPDAGMRRRVRYAGSASEAVLAAAHPLIDRRVVATLKVTFEDSPFLSQPRPSYELIAAREASPDLSAP